MNKLRSRNKICFQNNNPHAYLTELKLKKLKKKNGFFLKEKKNIKMKLNLKKKIIFLKKDYLKNNNLKIFMVVFLNIN